MTLDYLKNIVKKCSGFVKSNGYIAINNNILIMVSEDGFFTYTIDIDIVDPSFIIACKISEFIDCEDINELNTPINIKLFYNLNDTYNRISLILDNISGIEYYEDDITTIPQFLENNKSSSSYGWSNIKINNIIYPIFTHNSIFVLNKGDTCSLSIYNPFNDNTRLMIYKIYKKSLKKYINIITRQYIYIG